MICAYSDDPFCAQAPRRTILTFAEGYGKIFLKEKQMRRRRSEKEGFIMKKIIAFFLTAVIAAGTMGLSVSAVEKKRGWVTADGNRYYYKSDGTLATSSLNIGGIRYKFGKDGVCQGTYTGKVKSGDRVFCYQDGVKQEDELFTGWVRFGGKRFYARDGVLLSGWVSVGSDRYYVDPTEGRLPGAEKISVEFPDGAVYESTDGGKSWTKDGQKTARPSFYALFEKKCPVSLPKEDYWAVRDEIAELFISGQDSQLFRREGFLTVKNETGETLDTGDEYQLFREEDGKWVGAEMIEEWFAEDVAFVVEPGDQRHFSVPMELYTPIEGKYRYVHKFYGEGETARNRLYTVSVEFWAVNDALSE